MVFPDRIKAARKAKGMTQKELANQLGLATGTIQQYELGKREPRLEQLSKLSEVLGVPISFFAQDDLEYIDSGLQKIMAKRIRERIDGILAEVDLADFYEVFGTYSKEAVFDDIYNGKSPITLSRLEEIADQLGVTLDYLTGRTDAPNDSTDSLKDFELEYAIEEAEEDLLDTVRKICSMNRRTIARAYATGHLREVWNPKKLEIVREYLEDSTAIIQKMISRQIAEENDSGTGGADNGEHQTD